MKPNIVLILTDQMRGDCLGWTGHPTVETPYLDTMSHRGVVFTRAYSAVPSCIAARAAIMTGLSQRNHGRVGYEDGVFWDYETTLAGEFAKAGYHTQCVGKMHVYPQRNLMGFHNIRLHDGFLYTRYAGKTATQAVDRNDDYLKWLHEKLDPEADLYDTAPECNSWVARPFIYPEMCHPTNWVASESIDFLRRRDPTKPFFLKMSFYKPHPPLDPPSAYFDQYIGQKFPDVPIGDWAKTEDPNRDGRIYNCSQGIIPGPALHRARAAYYALITHIDHQIGRFLQVLQEYGELNNTIFLFTADHGEMLGDHNFFRKVLPYEGSAHIPFLIFDPGKRLNLPHGSLCDNLVELRDVMPTLLDCAGICIPDGLDGVSVLPAARGEGSTREQLHGEHAFGPLSNQYLLRGDFKYVWFSQTGEEQLFNVKTDPQENCNLAPFEPDRLADMRGGLIGELSGREEGYTDGRRLIVGRQPRATLEFIKERARRHGERL